MGADEASEGIAGDVGTLTAFAKTPAEFTATMLDDDTTLTFLPATGAVDIPTADILKLAARLVSHREVAHLTTVGQSLADVTLRTLGVDCHLTGLRDTGIAIMAQHHTDVEPL